MKRDEVILRALEREHKRLVGIAELAKRECDEAIFAGSNLIKIWKQIQDVWVSDLAYSTKQKKVAKLEVEVKRLEELSHKDILKLTNRQVEAESEAGYVLSEIQGRRFRMEMEDRWRP